MIGVFLSKGKEEWSDKYGSGRVDIEQNKSFCDFFVCFVTRPKIPPVRYTVPNRRD